MQLTYIHLRNAVLALSDGFTSTNRRINCSDRSSNPGPIIAHNRVILSPALNPPYPSEATATFERTRTVYPVAG